MKSEIVSMKWINAAKSAYRCHGCDGEFNILAGRPYLRTTVKLEQKLFTLKYCSRCAFALFSKMRSGKSVLNLEKGELKWHLLSSPFKKEWNEYCAVLKQWYNCQNPYEKDALKEQVNSKAKAMMQTVKSPKS